MPLRPLLHSHEQHTHRLLSEIEAGANVSQRSLARNLGIAVGLTNLIIRRVVRKGWVRMVQVRPNRVRYLLTPAGIAEKARMSRDSLQYSVRFYVEARERIRGRFAALSAAWQSENNSEKTIIFFGTGEVAEIGYICLQETDLELIAAIDDHGRTRFFDVPVYSRSQLHRIRGDHATSRLVVMSFEPSERINVELERTGFTPDQVFWV